MPQPSEDFLHRMYERSPVGFYRSTFDGRFLFVNPALVRMLRYERADEVMQLDLARDVYCDPADRTRLIAQYRETGTLDGLKVRWKTRGGAPLVVQLYGYLMPELDCIDATVIEVTELDAAQTRIEQQRQELERGATAMRLLWRQLPGLVWTVDRELTITFADGAAAPQLGHTIKGELGRSLYDFYGTDRDSYLPIRRHLEALEGRWVSFHQEVDGKQYAVTLGPQRAENGAIIGVVGVGLDVTTRHRLEQRMVDAQRAESLGVLAGGLAHDFNNLLAAILGNVSLGLREVPSGAPGHGVLESIRAGALDAAGLTSQLLAYAGRGELTTSDLTLAPILDELLRLAAPQIPAEVKVAVELPPELPPIRGDAGQLRQVVMNLVTNARDALAGRAGTITLTAQVLEHDGAISEHEVLAPPSAGRFVALSVADDGPGIDGDTLRRIFDPFFSTKPNGHGLGLASVLGIVRSHGGGISVYSRPGAGARFEILWPMRRRRNARRSEEQGMDGAAVAAAGRLAEASSPQLHLAPLPGGSAPSSGGRTVLIVDDEDAVRDVLGRLVEELGYRVRAAGAGDEALALLDGGAAVDCAILDLTMPGMSGGELLEAVRQRRPQLPIVVCSGHERDGKAMPAAEGFLAKPFRLEALEGMLAKLIGAASSAEAAAAARSAGEVASSSSSSQSSSTSSQSSSQSSSSSGDPGALRA
jgi:two-component system, cell cycle sensor histidine kinase and response regulator CckA